MDPQAHFLLQHAAALRRAGRVSEAIEAYERLLKANPDLPDSWYNLAWLQRQTRLYVEALNSYDEALRRDVSGPEEVHLNRAVILSDHLARPEEAEAELEKALRIRPNYLPALLNLGNLKEDKGKREEARTLYRRAVAAAPENALALSRLASVTDAQSEDADAVIRELLQALSSSMQANDRADLGFSLARLLDARGEYEQAFVACEKANRASKESLGSAFRPYDRLAQEKFVKAMAEAFPARQPGAPSSRNAPVFILGMYRSGSTLIEQMLARHSQIEAGGELDLVPALLNHIPDYPQAVPNADETTIAEWRAFYLDGVAQFARQNRLITDKRPDNFLHVGLIKTLFPSAKIIHTRRNRLDNLLSLYFLHLNPDMAYALDIRDAAHWYREYEHLLDHWKTLYPSDIFDVSYDELVRSPREVLEPLLAFLDLPWEDSVLEFQQADRAVKTASVWQVREALHTRSSGRWRNYSVQLKSLLGDCLE